MYYAIIERFLGELSKTLLRNRFLRVQAFLRRRIAPVAVCDVITEYAFRPSEVLGRRKYTYDIIFNHRALIHAEGGSKWYRDLRRMLAGTYFIGAD